jgi:hypothetical protein
MKDCPTITERPAFRKRFSPPDFCCRSARQQLLLSINEEDFMAEPITPYPVHLKGELSEPPSRALWLVKWLFILPHVAILILLWIGFVVVTVIAFFAVLFTGVYPRRLFEYNVGVLRWTWRVAFYSYGALGTDVYPPFSLQSFPYPADLQIDYPEKLTQWLVLFKWFLAIPHYAILAVLGGWWPLHWGGGPWWFEHAREHGWMWRDYPSTGLLPILILVVAVVLLFTGKYHRDIFRLVMGIERWVIRVLAYVGLMTDRYPHFRLWEEEGEQA